MKSLFIFTANILNHTNNYVRYITGTQEKNDGACIGVGLVAIIMGIYMYTRSEKPREEFESVTGTITYLDESYGRYHNAKTRYLKVDGYEKVFSIFIGHEPGDFSPKSEQVDKLAVGDVVTVYHSGTPMQRNTDPELDKGIQFLEKDGVLYYEKGNKDKYFAYIFIPLGLVIALLSFFRARKLKEQK